MGKKIYGVDITKKITPIMARDAVIGCFFQAHKEVLEEAKEYTDYKSEEEFKEMERLDVQALIKNFFKELNADFNNPTKKDIINLCKKLASYAKNFRNPEIIKKHYGEIMELVEEMQEK